jgi:hypothetical protein
MAKPILIISVNTPEQHQVILNSIAPRIEDYNTVIVTCVEQKEKVIFQILSETNPIVKVGNDYQEIEQILRKE